MSRGCRRLLQRGALRGGPGDTVHPILAAASSGTVGRGSYAFARLASEAAGPPGSRARPRLPRRCHECVLLLH